MRTPTEPEGRLTALGNQLIDIHLRLRERLASLRADLDAATGGDNHDAATGGDNHDAATGGGSHDAATGGGDDAPGDLAEHCVAFCSALARHHTGEDGGAFPALATRFPQLRPVIEELKRDHQVVAGILSRLRELTGGCGGRPDPRRLRAELDGLTAVLESHFVYEEKKLVAALNSGAVEAGGEDLFGAADLLTSP